MKGEMRWNRGEKAKLKKQGTLVLELMNNLKEFTFDNDKIVLAIIDL